MNPATTQRFSGLGRQTFDGLGRQASIDVGGRVTASQFLVGQLPPSANILANGQRVDFAYVPELDNALAQIRPSGEAIHHFGYDPVLGLIRTSESHLGQQDMSYTAGGKPKTDTWRVDGAEHTTTWEHSLGGQLLGFEDAGDVSHRRHFDTVGRLNAIVVGEIRCDIAYDDLSRPCTYTTMDGATGRLLTQTLDYDELRRERTRRFMSVVDGQTQTHIQTLTYTVFDQVRTRHWQDGDRQGLETFSYDLLGRLETCTADAAIAPADPFGNRVIEQRFNLNALDGYDSVHSTFADGSQDLATYTYANPKDPCQVSSISHTHASWPALIALEYDLCGRLVSDSLGRRLSWDAQDRVTAVEYQGRTCRYAYDPSGNLCDRTVDGTLARSFFSDGQMTHEQCGDDTLRPVGDGGQWLALERLTAGVRQGNAMLLGCDAQGSVRLELDHELRNRSYTAHGAETDMPGPADNPFGYTGQRREPLTGWYIPAGYRPYDPLLMIFLAPDSDSPFGRGGLNAYAYCAGDPINRIDPDGHSWLTWVIAGVGLALAVVGTVATFGAAAPAFAAVYAGGVSALTASGALAMGAATLGAVSLGTGIASTVLEAVDKDSKAASILGWVSLGTGLASTGLEMAPKGAALLAKTGRSVGRAFRRTSYTYTAMDSSAAIAYSSRNPNAAFIRNLHGTPMPAYRNHSNALNNTIRNLDDIPRTAAELGEDLAPLLRDVDSDIPLVLISCKAGRTGYAKELADSLGRPVFGYDEVVYIPTVERMSVPLRPKLARGQKNWLKNRVMRRTANPEYGGWRQAIPRLYTPDGWTRAVSSRWLRHLSS